MLKTLLGEVKEYKKDTLLTPVFMIFEVIFETVIPLIMGMIITELESGDTSLKKVYIYGGVMVLLALGALAAGVAASKRCGSDEVYDPDMETEPGDWEPEDMEPVESTEETSEEEVNAE